MMSDKQVEQRIKADLLQTGYADGCVIYLEGKSDPEIFFALLGIPPPKDGVHQKTLVRGFSGDDWASGNETVRRHVAIAETKGFSGKVYGIIDGDGADWNTLVHQFDLPHSGPLFAWKAYSIESLLPQVGWPSSWGVEPAWVAELDCYTPYAALNRLHISLRQALETLDLHTFSNPVAGQTLKGEIDVAAALGRDQHLLAGRDLAAEFAAEVNQVRTSFAASLAQGLATMNGKWLFTHFLPTRLRRPNHPRLRSEWLSHATAIGGLLEVRDLWERITGSPP